MSETNISNLIEQYLKGIIEDSQQVEIKRSEVADLFEVVPSQVNYVINTRFTIQNGYVVESKRGGGGYIRIVHIDLMDEPAALDDLIDHIGDSIGQIDSTQIIQSLFEDNVINQREANLMLTAVDKNTLRLSDKAVENTVRARVLVGFINRLRFEK